MEEKKTIIYKGEREEPESLIAIIENIDEHFITLITDTNRLILPLDRILKIKEKLGVKNDN
ncbi:MAG: hypothetical protein WC796_01955 [Candidatus Pacearchaeota archaeon]|jgi:hypothetical protein